MTEKQREPTSKGSTGGTEEANDRASAEIDENSAGQAGSEGRKTEATQEGSLEA